MMLDVESMVNELLKNYRLMSVPVDVIKLAEKLGLHVIVDDPGNADLSGALLRGEIVKIFVNSKHHERRQRFTISHEIGHYLLHPNKNTFVDGSEDRQVQILFRLTASYNYDSAIEREANSFAAALLMPLNLLKRAVANFDGDRDDLVENLSNEFNVSQEAMGYRLLNLGYINAA